jgi:hypothetical protein
MVEYKSIEIFNKWIFEYVTNEKEIIISSNSKFTTIS